MKKRKRRNRDMSERLHLLRCSDVRETKTEKKVVEETGKAI